MKSRSAFTAVLVAILAAMTLISSRSAQAAPATLPLTVTIDALTPMNPQPGKSLRVTGRVLNTSDTVMTSVKVQLRISTEPLTNREDVGRIGRGDLGPTELGPDNYSFDWLIVDVSDELGPGDEASFLLKVPLEYMPFDTPGVYVTAVEALAIPKGEPYLQRAGLIRSFLPWFPNQSMQDIAATNLVWMWPLADWPARDEDGVLLNNRTPEELSVGGRLDSLLTAAATQPQSVTWVLDSELLQTASEMSDGYEVMTSSGVTVGDKVADAQRWLSTLAKATSPVEISRKRAAEEQPIVTLPYANVDASAVRRAGLDRDVLRATTSAPHITEDILDRASQRNVYWAPSGVIDQPTAELLASAGVNTFVLADSALPPREQLGYTPSGIAKLNTGAGEVVAVLRDSGLTASLAMPAHTRSDIVLARQRFLAELGVITMQKSDEARTIVVGPSNALWDTSPALASEILAAVNASSFVRTMTLTKALEEQPSSVPRTRERYSVSNRNAELTESYLARVKDTQTQLTELSSVIDDPVGIVEPMNQALLRSESAAWRGDQETGLRLLRTLNDTLTDSIEKVSILSKGSVTFSGDNGIVPVTISNDLDRTVTIGIQLVGQPTLRLESAPVQGITVDPGKNATVEIPVRVIGGGTLPVSAQLLTPDGEMYGKPTLINLSSTAYARAAAWVIGIAFAAIAVFVVVGIFRRIRSSGKPHSNSKSGNLAT